MRLSVVDKGETTKHMSKRERERKRERGIMMVYIGRNNHRGHWPMINRTMLSLHVSSLSILKNDQRPFNKPTRITHQQRQP